MSEAAKKRHLSERAKKLLPREERRKLGSFDYFTGVPVDKDIIVQKTNGYGWGLLTGRVPHHIKNLNSALGTAIPPKRGDKGYLQYKRLITGLIGNLHFHLSEIDQ